MARPSTDLRRSIRTADRRPPVSRQVVAPEIGQDEAGRVGVRRIDRGGPRPEDPPRPEMLGTTAVRSPTVVVPVIETMNSLSMSELAMNVDPTVACPRAAMQASRAEVPVPHGDGRPDR